MARGRERDRGRVALVMMDGMAFDQWQALRADPSVAAAAAGASVGGAFVWVPTTTVYSRQALFAGEAPARIAAALSGTSGEASLWERFWATQGVAGEGVGYLRGLGHGPIDAVRALADDHRVVALGLVVDAIDQMMHGMTLGMAGFHDQVRHWARTGWLAALLHLLRGAGFEVFLTADHGNLEATGAGRLGDGALAEMRCERARVFSDAALRDRFAASYPAARAWNSVGLPRDQHVLVAAARMLSNFVDWGVLRNGERRGLYARTPARPPPSPAVLVWMIEALLRAQGVPCASLRQIQAAPALFPFALKLVLAEVRESPRMELVRQGMDVDVLALR